MRMEFKISNKGLKIMRTCERLEIGNRDKCGEISRQRNPSMPPATKPLTNSPSSFPKPSQSIFTQNLLTHDGFTTTHPHTPSKVLLRLRAEIRALLPLPPPRPQRPHPHVPPLPLHHPLPCPPNRFLRPPQKRILPTGKILRLHDARTHQSRRRLGPLLKAVEFEEACSAVSRGRELG